MNSFETIRTTQGLQPPLAGLRCPLVLRLIGCPLRSCGFCCSGAEPSSALQGGASRIACPIWIYCSFTSVFCAAFWLSIEIEYPIRSDRSTFDIFDRSFSCSIHMPTSQQSATTVTLLVLWLALFAVAQVRSLDRFSCISQHIRSTHACRWSTRTLSLKHHTPCQLSPRWEEQPVQSAAALTMRWRRSVPTTFWCLISPRNKQYALKFIFPARCSHLI